MQKRSLGHSIIITLIISISIVFLLLLMVSFFSTVKSERDSLDKKSRELLKNFSEVLVEPVWSLNYDEIKRLSRVFLNSENVAEIRIYFEDEEIEAQRKKIDSGKLISLSQGISRNKRQIGRVDVTISEELMYERLYSYLINSLLILVVILGAVVITINRIITTKLKTPVEDLLNGVDIIAGGDYLYRIPEAREEELNRIVNGINEMSDEIYQRDNELQEKNLQIEQELRERKSAEKALLESERKYRELVQNANSIIIKLNSDGEIIFFNEFAQDFFGFSEDEIIGRKIIDTILPEKGEEGTDFKKYIDDLIRNPEAYSTNENDNVLSDGTRVWLFWRNKAIYDENGNISGVLCIGNDITIRRKAEEGLRRLNEELEERVKERTIELENANDSLSRSLQDLKETKDRLVQSEKMSALGGLVAGVAHEINTPIGVVITASSYLKDRTSELLEDFFLNRLKKTDLESYLNTAVEISDTILQNLKRAAHLIQRFKQVAVDRFSEKKSWFNIRENISTYLEKKLPDLEKQGCSLEFSCPDNLKILSYPLVYFNVLEDLISNSLVHAFENQQTGVIILNIYIHESLIIEYSDNGNGMDEEMIQNIFNPFFTTKRWQGRVGLGLHIVYNMVTRILGGELECKSTPGEGTRFVITIPSEEYK